MREKMGEGLEQPLTKGQSTYAKGFDLIRKQENAVNHPEIPLHTLQKGYNNTSAHQNGQQWEFS